MRIALAQIRSGTDPAANLRLGADDVGRAADAGAAVGGVPGATMCLFGVPLLPVAEPLDGPWASAVRSIAARAGVVVIAGMFVPSPDGRVTNTVIATGPAVDTHYDKIHLYDAFGFTESRTVAPGREPVVLDVDGVGVGLTTCYDLRFPELFTTLARRGAQLITASGSWAARRGQLEQGTLPARACGTAARGKQERWAPWARARARHPPSYSPAAGRADPGEPLASSAPTG